MAGQSVIVPNAIASAYESLIETFRSFSAQADCGDVPFAVPPRRSFDATGTKDQVGFGCMLYLRNWRWRNTTNSKATVDILLHAAETLEIRKMILLKSSVRVNYFTVEDAAARLIQSVRYDYQCTPHDRQHPLFHAQTANERIEPQGSLKAEFTYEVKPDGFCCFPYARIPTSDMTLSSVLLSLAADHWAETFFLEFRAEFMALQNRLPQPDLAVFRGNFPLGQNIPHLKSSHWYKC